MQVFILLGSQACNLAEPAGSLKSVEISEEGDRRALEKEMAQWKREGTRKDDECLDMLVYNKCELCSQAREMER